MNPLPGIMLAAYAQAYLNAVTLALAGGMSRDEAVEAIIATIREAGGIVERRR